MRACRCSPPRSLISNRNSNNQGRLHKLSPSVLCQFEIFAVMRHCPCFEYCVKSFCAIEHLVHIERHDRGSQRSVKLMGREQRRGMRDIDTGRRGHSISMTSLGPHRSSHESLRLDRFSKRLLHVISHCAFIPGTRARLSLLENSIRVFVFSKAVWPTYLARRRDQTMIVQLSL